MSSQQHTSSTSTPSSAVPQGHPAFHLKRSRHLDTLNLTVEEYEHITTGAVHYHLASDNPENVFLVAFRTVPMDSTGVAHILEHTALCGSRKYPVRDPFFMMIRRSMNTFMNAFTSSDWTAYPFASQNTKDFNNLLEVYLDAVFFSTLHELDFAQEGHRIEFSDPKNPDTELVYRGVVYNEMKGAMSSPNSMVWQLLCKHLFPTTTYHYNSGGDPAAIPDLSYEQLRAFYKTHYHPSNAMFMTFGDIPAAEHQARMEELALKEFDRLDVNIQVGSETRYQAPIRVEEYYGLDEEDVRDKTHVVLAWLLGNSTDLEELYRAQLLTSVLLDNSASPLLKALETSNLGRSPSPLCGLEDSFREMSFISGLEACAEDSADAIESLILETLEQVAAEGIPIDKVEAALHTLELHQREISGDSYPYGLQLILAAMSPVTHRGDPIELLDIDPVLTKLKQEIQDPAFIPGLIREYLLDNPHRVLLTVKPDPEQAVKQVAAEKSRLEKIKNSLTQEGIQQLISRAELLEQRQNQEDDASILPKVELNDVPADIKWPSSVSHEIQTSTRPVPAFFFSQGTNGLNYQQVIIRMPSLPEELLPLLPFYTSCLPELGLGSRDYLEVQALQSGICGGVNVYTSMRSAVDDEQLMQAYLVVSSKGLYRNQQAISQLLFDTLHESRFDETSRIREIVEQICSRKEQSITSQGHALAMGVATSRLSPIAALHYRQSGLAGIKYIKQLARDLEDDQALDAFAEKFSQLHQLILSGNKQFLLIAEPSEEKNLVQAVSRSWNEVQATESESSLQLPETRSATREAWLTSTQVHFCAKAFPTVSSAHEDAPALTVLGGFLRNGYLHRAIREQGGAYGGGAGQDSGSAAFRFFSYRDPRLSDTLNDFDRSIDWLMNGNHDPSALEEAILGVISGLDKPASPAGSAKQAYYNELFGRTREHRARFRQRVLEVSVSKLQEVAARYLTPEQASIGVMTNKDARKEVEALGLEINTL